MKKKLAILTLYTEEGPSSNYRAFIFKDKLTEVFDVQWFSFWNRNYSLYYIHKKKEHSFLIATLYIYSVLKRLVQLYFVLNKVDILLVQKGVIPKLPFSFLKHLKRKKVRIVFDVDDAVYLTKNDSSEKIAAVSDLVICGNDILLNQYSKFNKNCVLLPTTDVTTKYLNYWGDTFENKVIGWIGSKTTVDNLEHLVDPLNKLIKKYPNVSFEIISNDALDFPKRIKNTKLVKWSSATYLSDLSRITIGVMPLEDNSFNRGKCGFKLIQYLNMKKPVIGSNVGINGEIIQKNGFTVNGPDEWYEHLETLLFNEEVYNKCVKNIENEFFEVYHFDIVAKKLIGYLEG